MKINRIKRLQANLITLRKFIETMHYRPAVLILPTFLALAAAVFDGVSIGLLAPTMTGLLTKNYSAVMNSQYFKPIYSFVCRYLPDGNAAPFIVLMTMIFIAIMAKNIFSFISATLISYQIRVLTHSLRKMVFERYLSFGKLFFDRVGIGHLNAVLLYFTEDVAVKLYYLKDLFQNSVSLIIYVALMLVISWPLTLFSIICYPVFVLPMAWIIENIKIGSLVYGKAKISLSQKITDILSAIPLVKTYARQEEENKLFQDISAQVARAEFGMDKNNILIAPIYDMGFTVIIMLSVFFVSYLFIVENAGSVPKYLVFFLLIRRCLPAVQGIASAAGHIESVRGPIRNVIEMLNDEGKYYVSEGPRHFKGLNEKIELRDLAFAYDPGKEVLKGISFSIEKGKATAIVGSTGSGKTTLINLLLRFYDCPEKTIFIDGTDIKEFSLRSLAPHFAMVSQDIILFNDSIKNNIIYGCDEKMCDERLYDAARKARLLDFIMGLPQKFDTIIGDRGVKLSGGEKQRLSIARAIFKDSAIFIMDEATSALDAATERLIQEALSETIKNKTAIIIAHRFSTVKNADKIIVIEQGRLAEQGVLEDLLAKKGVFYRYWDEQKFY